MIPYLILLLQGLPSEPMFWQKLLLPYCHNSGSRFLQSVYQTAQCHIPEDRHLN